MLKKAIFVDRDGVLNKAIVRDGKPYAPTHIEEFVIIKGVKQAIAELKESGYLIIVVTNQPDVGNKIVEKKVVEEMNSHLAEQLDIDGLKVCFHAQNENCSCRKPKPGMLIEAANENDISLNNSFMVGDRKSDIDAGFAAGCKTILINCNYKQEEKHHNPDWIVDSFVEASKVILSLS